MNLARLVGRAVVNEDNLVAVAKPVGCGLEPAVEMLDSRLLVVDGHNEAKGRLVAFLAVHGKGFYLIVPPPRIKNRCPWGWEDPGTPGSVCKRSLLAPTAGQDASDNRLTFATNEKPKAADGQQAHRCRLGDHHAIHDGSADDVDSRAAGR